MTTTLTPNGQQRRTLATQLDRLEGILDGLGQNLTIAVAAAVEQAVHQAVEQAVSQAASRTVDLAVRQAVSLAVQEAVQAVITEVLTNADLRAALAPPVEERPPRGALAQGLAHAWNWTKNRLAAGLRLAKRGAKALGRGVRTLGPVKGPLAVAAGVAAVGTALYFTWPWLAVAWGFAAGVVVSKLRRAREGLRRVLGIFAPASD